MGDKIKTVKLTESELSEWSNIRPLAHFDKQSGDNTFEEYTTKLKAWTAGIRKRNGLGDDDEFFFCSDLHGEQGGYLVKP